MATSDEDHVPVRDGHRHHPKHTAPEEMYWLSHMTQEDLKDKYVKLKDDFFTIKKFSCRQEDKIKKLQTKLRKLVADRKKDGGTSGSSALRIQKLEHQEVIDSQAQSIRELKLKNDQLEKKLKLASIQLATAKKNKPMLFRNVGPRVDSGLKQSKTMPGSFLRQPPRPKSSPPKVSSSEDSSDFLSPASIQEVNQMLPERVREILEEARERILRLEEERNDLQDQVSELQQSADDAEYDWQQKLNVLEEEVTSLRQELRDRGVREERDSVAIIRAQREAHTLTARSSALQEQLVLTEEKVVAEKSRSSSLQSELEKMGGKLTSSEIQAKEHLQELQHVKGQLQQFTEKNNILKRENDQLQKENQQLTKLRLAADQRGQIAEVESLKLQIAQLESALESDLGERGNFLERMTKDKEEIAKLETEAKELRGRNLQLQEELEKAKRRMELYDKAGLLSTDPKELLSAVAKDRDGDSSGILRRELEKSKQSHSELQLLYREKTLELERTSEALSRHASTYKSLKDEIEKINQEAEQKSQGLSTTIKSLQDTIKRREERSEKLEQQILMLTDKNIKDKLEGLSRDVTQNVKLSKHDNMLEFHIESMTFEGNEFNQLKTFVSWTVPFSLEDPLQHTNVAIGKFAHYNYSSLYKFHMGHRNLESLRDDIVTASVYILLESGHPAKVGECQLTFCEVLDHPRNTLHGTVPVVVSHDDADEVKHLLPEIDRQVGQVLGSLSYWFRLQRPCEKLIFQHLQNVGVLSSVHKREDQLPQTASNMIQSENPVASRQQTRTQEKTVHATSGLGDDKRPLGSKIPVTRPTSSKMSQDKRPSSVQEIYESDMQKIRETRPSSSSKLKSQKSDVRKIRDTRPTSSSKSKSQDLRSLDIPEKKQSLDIKARISESSHANRKMASAGLEKEDFGARDQDGDERLRSDSPSSTGTYNVGSPSHESPEEGSPSSTGTYNVESPKGEQADEATLNRRSSRSSIGVSPKAPPLDIEENSDSSNSHQTIRRRKSSVVEDPTVGAPKKPPRSFTREDDNAVPGTSKLTTGGNVNRRAKAVNPSTDESSNDGSGDDTLFEESASSSDGSEKSIEHRSEIKGRRCESRHEFREERDTGRERNISKGGLPNSRAEQLRSQSRIGSHRSEGPFSPSRSSITSDSDGVVAVVPRMSKSLNIYVEVSSLTLLPQTSVTQDSLIEFLFVDYHGFLDLPPEMLETPQSLPKPPPGHAIHFNFGQEFNMDERLYPSRKEALEELMRNRGLIKFTVTSEPPEELQDTHDCQDLGYAYVNLHDLLRKGQDLQEEDLVVENAEDGSEMGILRITLRILHILHQLNI